MNQRRELTLAIRVELRGDEPVEKALRRLKRLCNREGVVLGRGAQRFYEKPSERRRRLKKERMKTIRRAEKMRSMM